MDQRKCTDEPARKGDIPCVVVGESTQHPSREPTSLPGSPAQADQSSPRRLRYAIELDTTPAPQQFWHSRLLFNSSRHAGGYVDIGATNSTLTATTIPDRESSGVLDQEDIEGHTGATPAAAEVIADYASRPPPNVPPSCRPGVN
jgi:hypothetical protein